MGNQSSKSKEEEYLRLLLLHKGNRATEQDIKRVWDYFDSNSNGLLEVDEVRNMQRLRVSLFKEDAQHFCREDPESLDQIEKHAAMLVNHPEVLWRKLDINKDGHVRWDEFQRLAVDSILLSPFAKIIERYKKKLRGESIVEDNNNSNNYFSDNPLNVNVSDGNEDVSSPVIRLDHIYPLDLLGSERKDMGESIETVDDTVASLEPQGWEGVLISVEDQKSNVLTIRFPFATCYAHSKNVKIHPEKNRPDPPGLNEDPLKKESCSSSCLSDMGLGGTQFYFKTSMDMLSSEDIMTLSEEEMILLLPWLLTLPKLLEPVRRRLKSSRRLIRLGWWLRLADFHMVHGRFFVTEFNQTIGMTNAYDFFCRRLFSTCEEGYDFKQMRLYCPIWPEWDVCRIKVVKKFSSGNAPSLLDCTLEGLESFKHPLMYKPDDIRSDMCVVHSFGVFNRIWAQSKPLYGTFSPHVFTFKCCPMAPGVGVMEFIQGAKTLEEWDSEVLRTLPKERQIEFIETAAGSYVACYVLGCRDRHFDNFMVKDDHKFLQIDFKRCFDRKASGPVDAPHFSIKNDVKMQLQEMMFEIEDVDRHGLKIKVCYNGWRIFKMVCWQALSALRAKGMAVVKIVTGMFGGLRKTRYFRNTEAMQKWVLLALNLGGTDAETKANLMGLIDAGVYSMTKRLKNFLHGINVYRNKQSGPKEARVFVENRPHLHRRETSGYQSFVLTNEETKHKSGRRVRSLTTHCDISPPSGASMPRTPVRRLKSKFGSSANDPKFSTIDLSHQNYDESRVWNVYQLMQQRQKDLGKLDLSFNSFGLSGTRLLTSGLQTFTALQELYLAGLYFGPEGLKCVATLVHGNGVLETLDVHQCQVCETDDYSGLQELCKSLESIGCGLKFLDLAENGLKHKGLEMVRQAIETNYIIQDIRYENNDFMPTDVENRNIQRTLTRNQSQKLLIITVDSVKNINSGYREKIKAKIFFPGNPNIETPALMAKNKSVEWNFTTHFSFAENTIRSPLMVEVWGSKRIGVCCIPAEDLSIMDNSRPLSPVEVGIHQRNLSTDSYKSADLKNPVNNNSFREGNDKPKMTEKRRYSIVENGVNRGTLHVSVHAGDLLGGGILKAIAEYTVELEKTKRRFISSARHVHEQDVIEQMRNSVKNGFLLFEEGSDMKEDILYSDIREITMEQAMLESVRTFTKLKLDYRVGCHVVHKEISVPVPEFTKIFVGHAGRIAEAEESIRPVVKKASQEDLVSAMTRDSRRRSKQFDSKEYAMISKTGDGESRRKGFRPPPVIVNSVDPQNFKTQAKKYTRAEKMQHLILISDIFHAVCGKKSSELKGEELIDLLQMTGDKLPKNTRLKLRDFAMTKQSVSAHKMCVWLRKEHINANELKALLNHCREVGSPRSPDYKGEPMDWKVLLQSKPTPQRKSQETEDSDDGEDSVDAALLNNDTDQVFTLKPPKPSHHRTPTEVIATTSNITNAVAKVSAEAAAALDAVEGISEAEGEANLQLIEIKRAMNEAALKMAEAVAAAKVMRTEREARRSSEARELLSRMKAKERENQQLPSHTTEKRKVFRERLSVKQACKKEGDDTEDPQRNTGMWT